MAIVLPTFMKIPPADPVRTAFSRIADHGNALETRVAAVSDKLDALPAPLTMAQIQAALTANGSHPLNATALIGAGGGVSGSGIITRDVFGNRPASVTAALQIFVASDRGDQAWVWTSAVRAWTFLEGWGGPMRGTLSPNTKPAGLGTNDAGFQFTSTDFDRTYRWSGAAWADAPGEPPREFVTFRNSATVPTGWALCDGSAVTISTAAGGTTGAYATPNLTGSTRFPRANTAAGGTGGTTVHTHAVDPPSTESGAPIFTGGATNITTSPESADTTVLVAAGVLSLTYPSQNHTHDHSHLHAVDIASFTSGSTANLPPYYDLVPMIRL